MWYSAISELLMFGFGAAALWCWLKARRAGTVGGSGCRALFALALLSKESAVILLPLFVLTMEPERVEARPGLSADAARGTERALAVLSFTAARSDFFRLRTAAFPCTRRSG